MAFKPRVIMGGMDIGHLTLIKGGRAGEPPDFEGDILAFDYKADNFANPTLNARLDAVMNLCEARRLVHKQIWQDRRGLFNAHILSDQSLVGAALEGDYNVVNQHPHKYICFVGEAVERALGNVPRIEGELVFPEGKKAMAQAEGCFLWEPLQIRVQAMMALVEAEGLEISNGVKIDRTDQNLIEAIMDGHIDKDNVGGYLNLVSNLLKKVDN